MSDILAIVHTLPWLLRLNFGRGDNNVRMSGRSHSRDILPTITALLTKNKLSLRNLNYIVYGQGPGSFTGLRIAVGVVQGLAFGLNIPVVPVSSLACLAQAQYRRSGQQQIVSALHARKEEVYLGKYRIRIISPGCHSEQLRRQEY